MAVTRWLEPEIAQTYPALTQDALWERERDRPTLQYIVVDELEEQIAILVIEPWPELDKRGRLSFDDEKERLEVTVAVGKLEPFLHRRALLPPAEGLELKAARQRPLRIGDVFCAPVDRAALKGEADSVHSWLHTPLIDVSARARQAAKAQYFAAVGPVLSQGEVEHLAQEFFGGEPERD